MADLTGTPETLTAWARGLAPNAEAARIFANRLVTGVSQKQRVYDYQAEIIYALAAQFDRPGAQMLEVGTYYGYSAAVIGQACPQAQLVTLNPTTWEWDRARQNLAQIENARALCGMSQEYITEYDGPELAFVFVDGDHKLIHDDLYWFNWLEIGGLILFHDYSPSGSVRQCPPVYRALTKFAERLRPPDVRIIDNNLAGMAGWYRRPGEVWK